MRNTYILQRLVGLQTILIGVQQSSATLSSSSKGTEREAFIDDFLSKVLPPSYRFGTGDATDAYGARSGQLDVVVEHPIAPSLPSVGSPKSRLYLAESIAAVIEVKSDASTQWQEALRTAQQLTPLKRSFGSMMVMGVSPQLQIPLFVIGYKGWTDIETLKRQLNAHPEIAGILIIDPGLFASAKTFGGMLATGPWALWGLIGCIHLITNGLQAASTNPFDYA